MTTLRNFMQCLNNLHFSMRKEHTNRSEIVNFTFTRTGKWNQFTVNTSTPINAGNYMVRLVIENAKDLAISGIDVQ